MLLRYEIKNKVNILEQQRLPFLKRGLELCRDNHTDNGSSLGSRLGQLFEDLVLNEKTSIDATNLILTELDKGDANGPSRVFEIAFYGAYPHTFDSFSKYIESTAERVSPVERETLILLYLRSRLMSIAHNDSYMKNGGGFDSAMEIQKTVEIAKKATLLLRNKSTLIMVTIDKLEKFEKHLNMLVYDSSGKRGFDAVPIRQVFPKKTNTSADHWQNWRTQDFLLQHPYPIVLENLFPIKFFPQQMKVKMN